MNLQEKGERKMNRVSKILMVLVVGGTMLFAGADHYKKYGIKSAKIEYKISGSGDMMGAKMKTSGKKIVRFSEYGYRELSEENQIQKIIMMGHKQVVKNHQLTYMIGGVVYSVDFRKKQIIYIENPAEMAAAMSGKGVKQTSEEMLKQMGGEKAGTDKILGNTCDIWKIQGVTQCIYKGVPLKIEANVKGINRVEIATKVEFDISLSPDDFKLPDFPIYDMQGNKLDKSKLESMDK